MKFIPLHEPTKDTLLATGGVLGALGASSCCVLPLGLAVTGVSGAWIGTLTSLSPYQPVFLAAASLSIGIGFWRAYLRRRADCGTARCGTSASRRLVRASLWTATALLAVAGSVDWWAPFLA